MILPLVVTARELSRDMARLNALADAAIVDLDEAKYAALGMEDVYADLEMDDEEYERLCCQDDSWLDLEVPA